MRWVIWIAMGAALAARIPDEQQQRQELKQELKKKMAARKDKFQVGDAAPDFRLKIRGGGKSISLSSYRGKRPVALVFGSYT